MTKPLPQPTFAGLQAGPNGCQEASMLSRENYIPCNKPATLLVHWPKRKEGPYRMCAMCADHNVKNRGAMLLGPFTPDPNAADAKVQQEPKNTALPKPTFAELVAEHQKIRTWLDAEQKRFDEHSKPWRDRIEAIKAECAAQMQASGDTSRRTEHGTAILSQIDTAKIKADERDAYIDMCLDKWDEFGGEMLQVGAPQAEAVRNYMDAHDGRLPPHVEISSVIRFSIRKA